MASMNTMLNIEKLDGNIVQKHGGSKQVGFKQLGPCVETGVHGVYDGKCVWFEVELQGAQGDHKAKVFQVSNDDTVVAQRRLEDKQPEEKTKTACGVAKHLGVAGLQQQNGLVKETNVTLLAKAHCFLIQSGLSKVLWAEDTTMSTYLVNKVLQGDEFEVEPQDGHTFEGATLCMGTIQYREDSNKTAFVVAALGKIYAHESLTFNNTVACEVISMWKAGLKDDMDARSDVYVLSNGCKKCSDDSDGYYWESTLGDCDVEKNGKWSCIYAVGSQEYQMICTRLDITSADVDQSQAAYMTLTRAWKKEIWLKGLLAESEYKLSLVTGIATGALVKGGSRSEVLAQVEGAAYR
ncbi:hypothetical protein Tco_1289111, partial [Tanacetum coccineum]